MHYNIHFPPAGLQRFIRFFWTFETDNFNTATFAQASVASASSKMVFLYEGQVAIHTASGNIEPLFQSGIQAHTQKISQFVSTGRFGVLGVYFNPGALALMLSLPAHELSNLNLSLSEMLGQVGKELEERVMLARNNPERIDLLVRFFEEKLDRLSLRDFQIMDSIQAIVDSRGLLPIEDLADHYYVSRRQLERHFQTVAGFSPKLLSRIIRFENSIESFLKEPASLTDIAYRCGYFDQSHFIHDFRKFAGVQPSAYFSQDLSIFSNL